MQIETTTKNQLTAVRMAIIKKCYNPQELFKSKNRNKVMTEIKSLAKTN